MKQKALFLFFIFIFAAVFGSIAQSDQEAGLLTHTLMFPCAPNPCKNKCLIRTFLPQNDQFATIRIMNSDSILVKEVSMANETGISSALFTVGDLENGKYFYQLYYKGEIYYTRSFMVRH